MSLKNVVPDTQPPKPPARSRTWSLAARLTAWYAGFAFLVVISVTGYLHWALVTNLDREDDQLLEDKLRVVRTLLSKGSDRVLLRQEIEETWKADQKTKVFVRLIDGQGATLAETPEMSRVLPVRAFPPPEDDPKRGRDFNAGQEKFFRILAAQNSHEATTPSVAVIQVAMDRSLEIEILAEYRKKLWIALTVALFGLAVVGYQIAVIGTRPIREIAETARRIRSTNLQERIATSGLPSELESLAGTFNQMLDRLSESFDQLSRFSADIAHELRTPVNNLRGEIEVALSNSRSHTEYQETLNSCLEECQRLTSMVDRMLFLARAETPQMQIVRERLHLGDELKKLAEFYEASASEAGIELKIDAPVDLSTDVDKSLFQRAIGNLLSNSISHSRTGGTICISAREVDGSTTIEVRDVGDGIAEADLPHVFNRFYRADQARTSKHGKTGLGLAIVKSIVELHDGSVAIASQLGKGTCVTLRFPRLHAGENFQRSVT